MKHQAIYDLVSVRELTNDVLCLAIPGRPKARDYKAVIHVGSLSFALMSEAEQEVVLEGFRNFLSRVGEFDLTIHVKIEPYNLQPYLDEIDRASNRDDLMADIATDHKAFVLSLASQRAILQRDFHLTVGADESSKKTLTEAFDEARSQLDQRCTDIISDLERIGLAAHRMRGTELANYYLGILHQRFAQEFPITQHQLDAVERPVVNATQPVRQELATPDEPENSPAKTHRFRWFGRKARSFDSLIDLIKLPELLAPASIDIRRTYIRTHHISDEYIRGFAVVGYPRQVVAGWLDRLISINEPQIELALHLRRQDATSYISKLTRRITAFKATQKVDERRGRTANPYIAAALEEIDDLRNKLVRQEEQVFAVSLYLLVRASSKTQLEERSQRLLSQLRSLELRAVPLVMQHDKALQCVLPGRDILKRKRILDTSSLITAYPFSDTSLSTPTGILRGVTPQGNLVIMDDFSDSLENANECRIAKSGAGKSYDAKTWALRSVVAGIEVCIIDFENEHQRIVERLGGQLAQLIHFTDALLPINPFELRWRAGEESTILEEKYQSLLALFDLLLAERVPGVLSQREKAYLTKVLGWLYLNQEQPCMRTFYQAIRTGIVGPDTFELADRLERYVNLFPDETRVDLEKPYTVFNLRDLNADLQPIAVFLITEYTWTQMRYVQHPTPRILLVDEAWKLMQFEAGGRFLSNIARRARKYFLGLVVITQDAEDFLRSEHGHTVLANSSKVFLMKQDSTTIDAVRDAFKLSKHEEKYLLGCAKGEGLYFARGVSVPMQVVASPLEHQLATTNPREVAELEEQKLVAV